MSSESKQAWNAAQVKEQTDAVAKAVEQHRQQSKTEHFTAITAKEVEQKLNRVNSPFITSQGWSSTTPGGTFNVSIGVYNPDPFTATSLYLHVFVGSGNVDPVVGTFLLNVDTRFPRLTQPDFFGFQLAPGASTVIQFAIKVPTTVEKTNYLGNSCLMALNYHDVGQYLDRSVFPFKVQ